MENIFDLIKKQVNLLLTISKNDDSILLNLFNLVKNSKIPIQFPLSEKEIRQIIDDKWTVLKDFLVLKFDGIKNSDIVLVGIYSKHYANQILYIRASGDLSERALDYSHLKNSNNSKVKELDTELIKKNQKLPFLPIIFYSIPFQYKDTKSIDEQNLIEKFFSLESLLITL